ncbi:MAG: RecX family transcriptional regulator [Armatimonadaceae bacterium]
MEEEQELPRGIIRSRERTAADRLAEQENRAKVPTKIVQQQTIEVEAAESESVERQTRQRSPRARRITAIEPQERSKNRVNVYLDGTFYCGLFADVAAALGLKVGQELSPERLEELATAETLRKAKEDAYRLLSFRARSEREIADRLRRREYTEDVITETVRSLRDMGYLDDEAFASAWVRGRGKSRGKQALAFELRQKGVAPEMVRETLEARPESEEGAAARAAAIKRVGEKPVDTSREAQGKLAAYLARRGFGWEIVRPVLRELYGSENTSEEDADV